MARRKMSRRNSQRAFRKGNKYHSANRPRVMRGGIRF